MISGIQCLVVKFARICGATLLKSWDPNVTHVIAATDSNGACSRTLKVLMAILNGRWILTMDCKLYTYAFMVQPDYFLYSDFHLSMYFFSGKSVVPSWLISFGILDSHRIFRKYIRSLNNDNLDNNFLKIRASFGFYLMILTVSFLFRDKSLSGRKLSCQWRTLWS